MQPYFFPYMGYWQLLNAVDIYVMYDDVNFIKGGWINRNRILMDGSATFINVHMCGASPNKLINEVEVSDDKRSRGKTLRTLESCYRKAPYFKNVFPIFENILIQKEKNLAQYLKYSIKKVCEYLNIETRIIVSSKINKNNNLKGQDKILEICKILGANKYYNAIGGKELYSYDIFKKERIKLSFLKMGMIEYKQFDNKFVPNLSIIDVMMFNEPNKIKKMLSLYELL
jgi:hypothetical protein